MVHSIIAGAVLVLMVTALAGCGGGNTSVSSSPDCVFTLRFDETTYVGTYPQIDFEVGERLGTATIPPCNDTGGHDTEPIGSQPVYRIEGLDPALAIAVQDEPRGKRLLAAMTDNGVFAPTVQAFIAERDPNGSVLVTPDRDLADGETVTVTVRGLDTDAEMTVGQCAPVTGHFACLAEPIDDLTHLVTTTSMAPAPDSTEVPRTPTTALEGPEPVTTFTMTVHDPLRGDLELFDAGGDPVTGHPVPTQVRCGGASAGAQQTPCLIAVRGEQGGRQVIRLASIHFTAEGESSSPATD